MPNAQTQQDSAVPALDRALDCDLCIVGAGYAAINGLNAAAKYLPKGARVVVLDKNETWGGQWVRQYDFVRLHQPYRMFTAGDQRWTLDREATHLATRREVLDHFASVPAVSAGHLELVPRFGHRYEGHRVRGGRAEIDAVALDSSRRVRLRARRLLKATGNDIEMLPQFPLSSRRVRSLGVSDPLLCSREFLESTAPVYIIGGGKTAMDCIRHVATCSAQPRPIHVLLGSGMWFMLRDTLCPTGFARYTGGRLGSDFFLEMGESFDGYNESEVLRAFERKQLVHKVFDRANNLRFALLSRAEKNEVLAQVSEVHHGHLVDVEGTQMHIREGNGLRSVRVLEGSWFINCTSHFRSHPHQALLQDSGIVCAPQFALGFTGPTAFLLTHLWYRDALSAVASQLFRVRFDVEPKSRFAPQVALMVLANTLMIARYIPLRALIGFRGNNNRWFPLHRRVLTTARLLRHNRLVQRQAEKLLPMRFSDTLDAL